MFSYLYLPSIHLFLGPPINLLTLSVDFKIYRNFRLPVFPKMVKFMNMYSIRMQQYFISEKGSEIELNRCFNVKSTRLNQSHSKHEVKEDTGRYFAALCVSGTNRSK
jgi:hypothetical protein